MPERNKKRSFGNKKNKKKKHVYRDVNYLSDCLLKTIVQKHKAVLKMQVTEASTSYRRVLRFFVNMPNNRILIVQEENDRVLSNQ